ncbi:MAG: M28 family peptidase [Verrucomicrobiae bacterium]|nr:M28 family peptidase [Verrucomicrobiae bacterium]
MNFKSMRNIAGVAAGVFVFVSGCAGPSSSTRPAAVSAPRPPSVSQSVGGDVIPALLAQVSEENLRRNLFHIAKDPIPFRKVNYRVPGHKRSTLDETDDWIEKQLRGWGYRVERETCQVQAFSCDLKKPRHHTYAPPLPDAPFYKACNLYVKKTGRRCPKEIILLLAHKDSQSWTDSPGAYDNAVGTAAMLEIARVLAGQPIDAWIVWFDGEECVVKYDEKDGFYGSLHFVRQLFEQKKLRQIQAAIVLDMVADKRLKLTIPDPDERGAPLVQHVFAAAISLGLRDYVGLMGQSLLDDHMAFVWNGVPAIDLIDFDYGNIPGANNFWHTERDTLENCSPDSLRISGQIALELLRRLAFEKWPK